MEPLWKLYYVESPPMLAAEYDGTTALRDGVAVVVSGTFYA